MERNEKGRFVRGHIGYKFWKGKHPASEFKKGHKGYKFWKGKKFNKEHIKKIAQAHYKGGETINKGYVRLTTNGQKDGGRYKHAIIMEKYLGRKLKTGEVVHHINNNKIDNRIENLELLSNQNVHIRIHKPWK